MNDTPDSGLAVDVANFHANSRNANKDVGLEVVDIEHEIEMSLGGGGSADGYH